MKNKKFETIAGILLFIICSIGLIFYAVISKDNELILKLLISILFIVLFTGVVLAILYLSILKNKIKTNKIKKLFKKLKENNNRNVFEELYVLTFQQKTEDLVKQCLQQKNVKEIHSIDFENTSNMKVVMFCNYKGFRIVILFDADFIQYGIDSPARYDGTKANINFEKLSKKTISYEQFNNIEEFGDYIANLISELKEKIDLFVEVNIVDPIFNGRLLEKLKSYLSFLKKEGLVCVILSPPLIAIMLIGLVYSFVDVNYKVENPIGFYTAIICCSAFLIFFFVTFIYGIKMLKRRINFKKDYEQKNLSIIYEMPYKVKIIKEKIGKYSDVFYIKAAVLYLKNIKLIIPLNSQIINNRHKIKECCEECRNIKTELKYLTKSKIVIDGVAKYTKIIKNYLF